jgi:hypothetical protein
VRRAVVFLLCVAAAVSPGVGAWAAEFDNLVERGEFFLQKGAAYAPDAVRALEEARDENPERARSDVRFVAALAGAYVRVNRYTEAYGRLSGLAKSGAGDQRTAALMDFLLNEAGVGRLILKGTVPVTRFTASLELRPDASLDVTSRKTLERLNQFLAHPQDVGTEGITLLIPEGRYTLRSSAPFDGTLSRERPIEVWAGDEAVLPLIGTYPSADQWKVRPGNRVVELAWPPLEGASYRLARILPGASREETRYEGGAAHFTDRDVPLGSPTLYRLHILGPDGALWAFSEVEATAQPPVGEITLDAALQGDLTVALSWAMGEGSVDRMVVSRADAEGEKMMADLRGADVVRAGEASDGPIELAPAAQPVTYRIEVWVAGETAPSAKVEKTLLIPAQVARMESVREEIAPDRVYVEWETFPRDGLAQGYAVYRVGAHGTLGELVGRTTNAHAREFSYVPDVEPNPQWRHFVLPYIGDRFLVTPEKVTLSGLPPREDFDRRSLRAVPLPSVALSWDPYPGARQYLVRYLDEEKIIEKPYVELTGLQSRLMGTESLVEVFAVTPEGRTVPLVSVDLRYTHYPRQ